LRDILLTLLLSEMRERYPAEIRLAQCCDCRAA
jgi:hypothetical protein